MTTDAATRRPLRMELTNVETGDSITAQFNPDQVEEELGTAYNDLAIQGHSHKPKQFEQSDNLSLSFDLGFDALSTRAIATNSSLAVNDGPAYARRFLQHLVVPRRAGVPVVGGGPPRVLFYWPEMWSITCKVTKLKFVHKRFSIFGKSTIFSCKVSLDEARTTRLWSEDVLVGGTIRGE